MRRITIATILFAVQLLLHPASASAFDDFAADAAPQSAAIGIRGWFSSASAKWQISFPYVTQTANPGIPAVSRGRIESELDFNKIDSPLLFVTAGAALGPQFSLEGILGAGSIGNGNGIDTDRFVPDSGKSLEFSQSRNTVKGRVSLAEINLYYNNRRFTGKHDSPWGAMFGYTHYQDELHMTLGVQTVSVNFEGTVFPQLGPFPQGQVLDSDYTFSWDTLKAGLLFQPALTDRLSLSGILAFCPIVHYTGDGFWNLRAGSGSNDFRTQPPNFSQTSSTGYGWDSSLELTYAIAENVELNAGYRYLRLYATNGTDTTFFADGSADISSLDWVSVTRQGAYAGALVKF